jgi:hypothetical protein
MEALAALETTVPVVNVALPDIANPVLARRGLAPACGAGNSDLLHAGVVVAAMRELGVGADRLRIELLAHHAHVMHFLGQAGHEKLPARDTWHLRIEADGKPVDGAPIFLEAGRTLPLGVALNLRTGASAAKNARFLVGERERAVGIDRIDADGSVVYDGDSVSAISEVIGYDCRVFDPGETEQRADELLARLGAASAR